MQKYPRQHRTSPSYGFVRCCHKGVRLDVDADWDVVKNTISIE